MRFLSVLASAAAVVATRLALTSPEYVVSTEAPEFYVREPMGPAYTSLHDLLVNNYRRDAAEDQLTNILLAVNRLGLVEQILNQIALLPNETDNLGNLIVGALIGGQNSTIIRSLNASLNTLELLHDLTSLGVLQSTFRILLFPDHNRERLATDVANLLHDYPWIGSILNNIGAGQAVTFDMIFSTVNNFVSKWNGSLLQVNETYKDRVFRRDLQYAGSFQSFLNNLIGSAVGLEFAKTSVQDVLGAVNRLQIAPGILYEVLENTNVQKMIGSILTKLNDFGILDMVPLNDLFQKGKKSGVLLKGLQFLLTDPTWSPKVALVLQQVDNMGAYRYLKLALYGP